MISKIKHIKDRVRAILTKSKKSRDNDKVLWLKYLETYTPFKEAVASGDYEQVKAVLMNRTTPTPESISRARRLIQQQESDLAGEKAARKEIAEEMRTKVHQL